MRITTGHEGASMTVRVSGALTEAGTRHLAAMLNAMVTADADRTIVHLTEVSSVGAELLRVLRTARTRLRGRLTVTADRPEGRLPLALVGLGDTVWPEHRDRDGAASQVLEVNRHTSAARTRASTLFLPRQVIGDVQSEVNRDAPFRA